MLDQAVEYAAGVGPVQRVVEPDDRLLDRVHRAALPGVVPVCRAVVVPVCRAVVVPVCRAGVIRPLPGAAPTG
ncbi:hypothetical protein Pen02_01730 [Plantactinospora endophytica]|uniref:Uncharacterized protein n=1 Tax=Plantactinospora endophytica TaxID=673535 RepID=A0ABQ4DS13_9ACTN|nr:hypothetical protein Pen02_01730 [Plantactinospora endophytica]